MLKSELQAALDLCVEALEAVGFVESDVPGYLECHWCKEEWHDEYSRGKPQHRDDCLRERALAVARKDQCP